MNQNEDPKDGIFRNNATVCIYDFIIEKSSHEMKAQFLISAVDVLAQLLWKWRASTAQNGSKNVLQKIECVIWRKACQLEAKLQTCNPTVEWRLITFLAVNDEVSLLIAGRYGVDYAITIWVFCQHCSNKGVGPRILRNKRSISAETELRLNNSWRLSHKSMA